jgi:uncharacterized protein
LLKRLLNSTTIYRQASKMAPNMYLLAADNDQKLLPLLRENPSLASQQDEHGYSLIHAAASYNHLDLLRALVTELQVPVHLRDEDAETGLFVVETTDAARCLVEELGLDIGIVNAEGQTARQKLESEGEFPAVVEYLATRETVPPAGGTTSEAYLANSGRSTQSALSLPPVPSGLSVSLATVSEGDVTTAEEPDPVFRQRIEQLAAREDFDTPEGQAALRQLVEDAVAEQDLVEEGNARRRQV